MYDSGRVDHAVRCRLSYPAPNKMVSAYSLSLQSGADDNDEDDGQPAPCPKPMECFSIKDMRFDAALVILKVHEVLSCFNVPAPSPTCSWSGGLMRVGTKKQRDQ